MRTQTLTAPIFITHPLRERQRSVKMNEVHRLVFKKRVNLKVFWMTTFILMLLSLVIYIFQVNFLTREVYLIGNYEKQMAQLTQENENLAIGFSKANSLTNLDHYLQNEKFEKVSQVKYIQIYKPVAQKTSSR